MRDELWLFRCTYMYMTFFAHNEFNHFIGEEISAKKTQSRDFSSWL